jgi:hypothetical protein
VAYTLTGELRDSSNNPPGSIVGKADDTDQFYDYILGSATTGCAGKFEILFDRAEYNYLGVEGEPQVYLVITDSGIKFVSVKDRQGIYSRYTDNLGNIIWIRPVLDNLENTAKCDIEIMLSPRKIPKTCEAVVIDSGFGGTIISLRLANKFEAENSKPNAVNRKRICIFERGQRWISHEIPQNA